MLMGEGRMSKFEIWLMGVIQVESANAIKEENCVFPFLAQFEEWLRKKHKVYSGARKSFGLALRKAKNDDVDAFHLWMKWYDEYVKEMPVAEPGT